MTICDQASLRFSLASHFGIYMNSCQALAGACTTMYKHYSLSSPVHWGYPPGDAVTKMLQRYAYQFKPNEPVSCYLLKSTNPPSTCSPTIIDITFTHPKACRNVSAPLTTNTTPHCAWAVVGRPGPLANMVEQYAPFQFVGCHAQSLHPVAAGGCVDIGTHDDWAHSWQGADDGA